MRKLIIAMSVSLDGYVDGPDHDSSWIKVDSEEDWKDLFRMLENVDLLLLGGGMFAEYRDHWKQALTKPTSAGDLKYAQWAEKHRHIVFSKSIKNTQWENTTTNAGDVVEEVKKIKSQPGKDIYVVGGAKFASTLLDAGLFDELRLVVNPWIIGGGKSLFNANKNRHALKLIDTKQIEGGLMLLRYEKSKQPSSESK